MSEPNGFMEALAKVGGVLLCGAHGPGPEACLLEAESVRLGIEWTADPRKVRMFDLCPLNDAFGWGARARTEALTPVWRAYAGSLDWPQERQLRVVERVVVGTVRELIADLPWLPEDVRAECRAAETLEQARAAATAAAAAGVTAAYAAAAAAAEVRAAKAAGAAARAAYTLARDNDARIAVARKAAAIWLRAAQEAE